MNFEKGKEESVLCKKHIHRRGHNPIIPRIRPVAPVIRHPLAHVVDHAPEKLDLPPRVTGPAVSALSMAMLPVAGGIALRVRRRTGIRLGWVAGLAGAGGADPVADAEAGFGVGGGGG